MEKWSVCKHVKLACLIYLTTRLPGSFSKVHLRPPMGPMGWLSAGEGSSSPPGPPGAAGQVRGKASKLPHSVEALLFLLTYFLSQSRFAGFLLALHGTQPLNGRLSQSSLHCSLKLRTIAHESPFKQSTPLLRGFEPRVTHTLQPSWKGMRPKLGCSERTAQSDGMGLGLVLRPQRFHSWAGGTGGHPATQDTTSSDDTPASSSRLRGSTERQ